MHDLGVINPLSHFCQQPVVPDIVKVGPQVEVEDARLPLDYCLSHSLDRVMCCPLGPISKRLEIHLEDRFEYELERALHHADRRNRKDADFAPVLWYLLPPGWEWLVGVPSQLVPELLEQSLRASMASKVTPSPPGAPSFCLAIAYAARRVSILQTWTYRPQKRQDGSALTYILRLRSCKSMDAFIISSLPSLCWRRCKWQGPFAPRTLLRFIATTAATLSSTSRFRRLYGLPCSGDFSLGRGGFLQLLSMSLSPCCRFHPAKVSSRVGQISAVPVAFPPVAGSALGDSHFRGHNAFTFVTA